MTRILTIGMGWFGDEPGGLNRMYAGLQAGLEQTGARVRGLLAGPAELAPQLPRDVTFFAPRQARTISRLCACRRATAAALRTEPVDVVAAHFALYALPLLDMLRRQPFVFHFHGPWASESRAEQQRGASVSVKRAIEACVYSRADRFIVLSAAFAAVLQREHRIAAERIFVVPGGIDAGRYGLGTREQARARLGLPLARPLIGSVRRLVHRVGLEGVIDAMKAVRTQIPEALLLIAGRGPLAAELGARIVANGLEHNVRLLGFVADTDLPLLYRACDLSVVPSVTLEGFGLSAIESLAAGTPALVTPVGGLPETVAALDPALVLAGAGIPALADGILQALRDPGGLPTAETCMRYAREHFDWPVIAGKVRAVYELGR